MNLTDSYKSYNNIETKLNNEPINYEKREPPFYQDKENSLYSFYKKRFITRLTDAFIDVVFRLHELIR